MFLNGTHTNRVCTPETTYCPFGPLDTVKVKQSLYRPGVAQRVPGS